MRDAAKTRQLVLPMRHDGHRFHRLIRELQPAALINNRIGLPGDFATPEQRIPKGIPTRAGSLGATDAAQDSGVSSRLPRPDEFQPWETCMTINDTWGFNRNDRNYKSASELIRTLVEVASKGGTLLLNVGPAPDGTIQPEFEERLLAVGSWLRRNGEAIYGTTYGPRQDLAFGKTTAKDAVIYLHLFQRPGAELKISGVTQRIAAVTVLPEGTALGFKQTGSTVTIDLASGVPDTGVTVLKIRTQ